MKPKKAPSGRAQPNSLGKEVYERIREDIISCVLAPGESCSEGQLAEIYGVGKGPVRLALAALSREGLLTAIPRRGHRVAPLTIESVNDGFGVRLILEPAAAKLAAGRVDIEQLKELDARLSKYHQQVLTSLHIHGLKGPATLDRRIKRGWVEMNKEFHIEITRAAGNDRLTRIVTTVLEEEQRANHVIFSVYEKEWKSMGPDHGDIIDALARGDGESAELLTRGHLERSRRVVIDALLSSYSSRRVETEITIAQR